MNKKLRTLVESRPHLARLYRILRDQLFLTQEPVVTPWGFKLAGNESMEKGDFEPFETELVRDILQDVDVLVNVGANIGYYCCHALSIGKKVIAFEPIQRNVHYLCKNIKANGWSGAEVFPMALSNDIGILEIYGGDTGASLVKGWAGIAESYVTLVPSSTLDIILGNRLEGERILIIADIEGAEKAMLEGAVQMLANNPKPIWLIEISVTEHQPQGVAINPHLYDTFKYMFDAGYQQAYAVGSDLLRVTMSQVEAAQSGDTSAFRVHNFLFRHE